MLQGQKILRKSDQKIFTVIDVAHWSDIRANDGETDSVKWYGGSSDIEHYVSQNKGHDYVTISGKVSWDTPEPITYNLRGA
jgi:hypothetical protein